MTKLESRFLKNYQNQSYLIQKKAQFLLRFSLVMILICLIGLGLVGNTNEWLFYGFSLASFILVIWAIRRGSLSAAIWVAAIMMSGDILIDVLSSDPITYQRVVETVMESFLSYILIGFVAVNKRQIIYGIVSNTALTALHAFLIMRFGYAHSVLPDSSYRYFIGGLAAVLLVGLFTLAVVSIHEQAITMVEEQQNLLAQDNQYLEVLVHERTTELEHANRKLEKLNHELITMSMYDELTGIRNRRKTIQDAEQLLAESATHDHHVCLSMLDIDHFKRINDTYGHAAGDLALRAMVQVIQSLLKPTDVFGRIGGEEFLIVLSDTTLNDAERVLDQVKRSVEVMPVYSSDKRLFHLTVSIGVAQFRRGTSLELLMHEADTALYEAKARGRNQVSAFMN